jgi:hypothetical protein
VQLSSHARAQARVAALCASVGLTVLPRLTADDACDVCVAKNVRTEPYRVRGVLDNTLFGARKACPSPCAAFAQAARDRAVPIVSEEWTTACAAAGRVLDSAAFLLPPFAGLHICCTGVEPGALRGAAHAACDAHPDACAYADVRLAIRDNTQANGGVYHSEMTKSRCTHLIATSADSDKYRHAVMWGTIKVVSAEWFEQSLEAKGKLVRLGAALKCCFA